VARQVVPIGDQVEAWQILDVDLDHGRADGQATPDGAFAVGAVDDPGPRDRVELEQLGQNRRVP